MKKLLVIIICFLSLSTSAQANNFLKLEYNTQSKDNVVYITRTGAKYHREYCGYLRKSSIKISLTEATKKGYTACSKCF